VACTLKIPNPNQTAKAQKGGKTREDKRHMKTNDRKTKKSSLFLHARATMMTKKKRAARFRAPTLSRFFFRLFCLLFFFSSSCSHFTSGEKDLNPYAILGVDKNADASAIKRSYRKLSLRFHPDKQQQNAKNIDEEEKKKIDEKFMNIQMAYKTLIDPEKRRNYDVTGYANLKDLERDERRKEKEEGEKKGGYHQRFAKKKGSSSSSRMKRGGWDSEEQTIDSIDSETFDFTSLSAFESIVFNRRKNNNNNAGNGNTWLIEVYDDASEPSQRASSSWEQAARALDGFAKFGRVNQKLYRQLAVKVAPKYFMSDEPIAFSKLPAVVGFAQGCNNFWCAQRYRGEMKADDLGTFVMDKLLRLKEVPSVTSEELEQNFAPTTTTTRGNIKEDKVKFIVFSPRATTPSPTLRKLATDYSNDVNVVRIHHTERDQGKWKRIYGVESAPAVVVLKSESNEVIVKHGVSGKESLKSLFAEHHLQLIPEITSRSADNIRCKSGGLTRLCVLILGDGGKPTEALKLTLSSIKKDLRKERDETREERLDPMKMSIAAALENDEVVFARIDCAKQKKACHAYSFKSGSSNAELRALHFTSDKSGKINNEIFNGNAADIEQVYEWIGRMFNTEETSRWVQDEVSNALLVRERLGLKTQFEQFRTDILQTLARVLEESAIVMVEIGPFPIIFMLVLQISLFRFLHNRKFAKGAQNVSSADSVDTSTFSALDANDVVMNLSEISERTTALTKSVYVVLQFVNSREKGAIAEQIQDLQALAKKFKSERLLRFAYVDVDQNVSWKSFVNDVGEDSVCVWHPSKLKYEKLGSSCAEDGVRIKLDAVLDGSANWEKEIKDNAWFHSSNMTTNREVKK
jgi:curved DNA-binding protein CbpA